jgi:tetratricopeptide (TPR) repeat protein
MRARMGSVPPPPTDRDPEPDTESYTRPADADRNVNVHVHLHTNAAAPHTAAVTRSPEAPPHGGFDLPKRAPALSDARPQDFDVPRAPIAGSIDLSSPLPPPTAPVRRAMSSYVDEDEEPMRGRSPSLPDAPASLGRRRSVGGFLVAVVVLVGVGILGAVWAKDHLGATLGASKTAPVATADPRVASFLSTGEKALVDGNLDLAKESFDKASALAEKDPHVLLDVARLAAIRADTAWLKSRLLPSDAADEHRATRDALAELSQAARRAAEDAIAVAPEDPAALRAKVDALRISGDPDAARGLVAKVAATGSVPESAYVLAALDLAAPEPLWSQVIGRLRTAASAEVGPGRARAALAYALARSGDVEGAKGEVDRLASMPRQHPLLPLLRAYTERAKSQPKVDAGALDAGTVAAADDPGAKPRDGKHGGEGGGGRPTGDGRQLVAQAEHARAKGDFDRASVLYAAALDRNPNDTEALSGLAAIAHARHDLNGARASYKRVLSINPSYVPALVGVGDVDWESGDRASAMKTYKEIVDRFPEGSYPPRVRQRLEAGGAPAPSPGASDPGGG